MNASLYVQRLDRAADLASSTGLPIKCLVFPASGGVQAIDAAGTITSLVGSAGALTATVTDAVTNGASTALTLRHALSAGVGANGIGVSQSFVLPDSLGVANPAGLLTVSFTDATAASEDAALGISLAVGGTLTACLSLTSPTAGATTLTAAGAANSSLNLAVSGTGNINLNGGATGGVSVGVNAASKVGLYNATPVVQALAITPVGAFTDPPSAAEMAALRTAVNAIITAIGATSGVGITA